MSHIFSFRRSIIPNAVRTRSCQLLEYRLTRQIARLLDDADQLGWPLVATVPVDPRPMLADSLFEISCPSGPNGRKAESQGCPSIYNDRMPRCAISECSSIRDGCHVEVNLLSQTVIPGAETNIDWYDRAEGPLVRLCLKRLHPRDRSSHLGEERMRKVVQRLRLIRCPSGRCSSTSRCLTIASQR